MALPGSRERGGWGDSEGDFGSGGRAAVEAEVQRFFNKGDFYIKRTISRPYFTRAFIFLKQYLSLNEIKIYLKEFVLNRACDASVLVHGFIRCGASNGSSLRQTLAQKSYTPSLPGSLRRALLPLRRTCKKPFCWKVNCCAFLSSTNADLYLFYKPRAQYLSKNYVGKKIVPPLFKCLLKDIMYLLKN